MSLVGIVMTEPPNQFNTVRSAVLFDELTAINDVGGRTIVEGFDGDTHWLSLPSAEATADEFTFAEAEEAFSGAGAAKLDFRVGVQQERRGIYVQDAMVPIGALASRSFMEATGSALGTVGLLESGDALVPYVVRGVFDLFPTLESSDGPALVLNRDQLADWTNSFTFNAGSHVRPEEIWLSLAPDADRELLTERLVGTEFRVKGLVDRQKERATIESNPLIAAGGAGILVVSFLAILVLVGAALLVSLWMAVQRRRTEFAVMRAMGVSRGQILRLLAFEYMLVAAVGLLVGAYLGLMVGRQMLSFLDVTETGERVEPGFILQTDWGFVAGGAAAVLGIFVLALFLAVRVLARTSDAQALRTE
jgi:ABC-type antimicrobial peptide transport system permease subunit